MDVTQSYLAMRPRGPSWGARKGLRTATGLFAPPVWNERKAKKSGPLKREDLAYPGNEVLADTDRSLELQSFYWSVVNVGMVFRAQDSVKYYCVEFGDIARKKVSLFTQLFISVRQ